jgi:hypothetical protein
MAQNQQSITLMNERDWHFALHFFFLIFGILPLFACSKMEFRLHFPIRRFYTAHSIPGKIEFSIHLAADIPHK